LYHKSVQYIPNQRVLCNFVVHINKLCSMKKVLEISRPKSNSYIIWEHLMKSAVAFIGTFAMLFFGPMMAGSRSRGVDAEDRLSFKIIQYLIEHPEVQIGLSVFAVVILNIYIIFKNQKIKYIVKIEYDDSVIQMELTNLYYSKKQQIEIPTKDFEFYIENSVTEDNEKRQKIVFRNTLENRTVGEINTKHFFWSDHMIQLRNVIQELEQYRKISITANNRKPGLSALTKWK